jgi:hypothetical protein
MEAVMITNKKKYLKIIELLKSVATNKIEADKAILEWPDDVDLEQNRLIRDAWHSISHFQADADLRMKDVEYADLQREQLLKYAYEIEAKYIV